MHTHSLYPTSSSVMEYPTTILQYIATVGADIYPQGPREICNYLYKHLIRSTEHFKPRKERASASLVLSVLYLQVPENTAPSARRRPRSRTFLLPVYQVHCGAE